MEKFEIPVTDCSGAKTPCSAWLAYLLLDNSYDETCLRLDRSELSGQSLIIRVVYPEPPVEATGSCMCSLAETSGKHGALRSLDWAPSRRSKVATDSANGPA